MAKWEYRVEQRNMSDRWSAKRQAAELEEFQSYLNALGAEGWEMVSYEPTPLTGAFTKDVKGYAYLLFLKRARD